MTLPPRTADTMSMAIALSSPSGRMSKRARAAAEKRLAVALFGESGLIPRALPPQPSQKERLLQQAATLRDLVARGMRKRAFTKEADRLETEAAAIES